jgi:hypothetical protein
VAGSGLATIGGRPTTAGAMPVAATPGAPPFMNTGAGSFGIAEQAAATPLNITTATAPRTPRRLILYFPMSPLLARPPTRKKAVLGSNLGQNGASP